jgi:hypothetical protein
MKNGAKTITACCRSCGKWFFRTWTTRPPVYCLDCADYRKRESNRFRQRKHRQARRAEKQTGSEGLDGQPPQPALVDTVREPEPYTPTSGPGLFSSLPEPGRTHKRKEFGL